VGLAVVAVEDDEHRATGTLDGGPYLGKNLGARRAADQERDPRMPTIVHPLDVDAHDLPLAHEIEEVGVEESRSSVVRPALDEQIRPHGRQHLLDRPEVQHVLPDRVPEPGDGAEVLRRADEVHEEQAGHRPPQEASVKRVQALEHPGAEAGGGHRLQARTSLREPSARVRARHSSLPAVPQSLGQAVHFRGIASHRQISRSEQIARLESTPRRWASRNFRLFWVPLVIGRAVVRP
jgi:hypothetical protein